MKLELENAIYEKEEKVAIIKLNRPKVNAATPGLYKDLISAFTEAGRDPEVRAIVVEGEGRCFSAGADIKAVPTLYKTVEEHKEALDTCIQQMARCMRAVNKPIIAACHGYALGGGLEVALNADIIIAAEGCRFGFPEAGVGAIVTKGTTKILPLLVGLTRAKELLFTCDFIDAEEAKRIGLVNKVVPVDEMHNTAMEMAKKIAKNYPLAVRSMRVALDRGVESPFETALEFESYLVLASREEREAGMRAKAEAITDKKEEA